MMKSLVVSCFLLFFAGVVIFLAQLWVQPWRPDVFVKIIITDMALFAIVFVIYFLVKENKTSEKINSGKDL